MIPLSEGLARRPISIGLQILTLVAFSVSSAAADTKALKTVDFARQIRPILSDNCFACHGPDDKARKGKLRLDLREDVMKPAKSGKTPVTPGKVEESEIVRRIHSTDPDEVMPPPKFGKKLADSQKDLLKRWVAEGAAWTTHWAFEPAKRPAVPEPKNVRWAKNDIDRFVLARLEKEGLQPSKAADKTTLIRRASLDLTGLPPTPEEVDAFLSDRGPDAYEKLIDRLMSSPRYGEQMARSWLDAARYADSHGYHIDSERHMWKYRDWVVKAFNENMPFDQFTLEQLAGDLLPNPTLDQKVASGYVRANMSTGEGGAIIDEYQAKYTFDRTETTSTIWMGLTMTCARCHTHKYDPITHKEYYSLYAFFNNLRESVMDGNAPNPDPAIQVPTGEQSDRLAKLKTWIADGQKKVDAANPGLDQAQAKWESEWRSRLSQGWSVPELGSFQALSNAQHRVLGDGSVLVSGANPPKDVYELTYKLEPGPIAALRLEALPDDSLPQKSSARSDDGKFRLSEFEADWSVLDPSGKPGESHKIVIGQAVADAAIKDREIEKAIDGKPDTGWQPTDQAMTARHTALLLLKETTHIPAGAQLRVRLKFEASVNRRSIGRFRVSAARNDDLAGLLLPPKPQPWQVLGVLKAGDPIATLDAVAGPEEKLDFAQKFPGVREEARWGARGDLEDGKEHVLVSSLHGVHGVYYLARTITVPRDQRVEVALRGDDLFKVWLNRSPIGERRAKESPVEGPTKLALDLKKGDNTLLVKLVNVQGDTRFRFDMSVLDASILPPALAVALAASDQPTKDQASSLRNYFRRVSSPEWRRESDQLVNWRNEESGLNGSIPTTMVAREETEKPRETFMLMRGEYDKPGEKVSRGVPAILPPFPKDAPTNRLGLAKWLLMPGHPLTARVSVNRLWQLVFGVGFVKTPEDFGTQSEPPSHPELLDWLATEFVRSGWDVRHVQKLILTSATYCQSSKASPELRAKDPDNRLLARGPRFRVDAESVRDEELYISGLLVEKVGGKSVKPYEPSGLWEAVSFNNSQKYVPDEGEGQYRRSLYTHWKRQSPPPNMLLFDAPTREFCVVKRPRTNTPLQALALLNDPQFVECSRAFADRILREGGPATQSRLTYAFRRATARKPAPDELKLLEQVLSDARAGYAKSPESAKQFLKIGAYVATSGATPSELAAWAHVASLLLNLDETLTKN
ncbi:MAG: PSD1 domain-containing protein [Verrucomicrobia bacterium]|nr:PSD1 domain-containing protein [Verrucomicrobiota bacterium]MBI3869636.1 PSD1 domain-containing protein [Verrucomicrobiota bacterium]